MLLIDTEIAECKAIEHMLAFMGASVTRASDLSHMEMASKFRHILIDGRLLLQAPDSERANLQRWHDRIAVLANIDDQIDHWHCLLRPVTASALQGLMRQTPRAADAGERAHISCHTRFDHLSVLVAEDNDVNRDVIRAILGALRIQPVLCKNGEEATAAYRAAGGAFDLVLMDCEMPVMDGITATQKIREIEQQAGLSRTPIVALTAHVLQEQRQRMVDAGMDNFLSKPVRKDAVQKLLADLGMEKHLQVVSFDNRRDS